MRFLMFVTVDPDLDGTEAESAVNWLEEAKGKRLEGDRLRPVGDATTLWPKDGGGTFVSDGPFAETNWQRIADLYALVVRLNPSPVVELNRAVAVAEVDGPAAALALVDALCDDLPGYYLLPATRAELLSRLHRFGEARSAYEEALALAPTDAEGRFLTNRINDLG